MDTVLVKFLPFECRLTLVTSRRLGLLSSLQQWLKGEQQMHMQIQNSENENQIQIQDRNGNRELLVLDFDMLGETLIEYFNEYLKNEFSGSLYAPFSNVALTGIDRRKLEIQIEPESVEFNYRKSGQDNSNSPLNIASVKSGNLRTRRGEVFNISKRYDGVAVFTRDGDLPIPPTNYLQSKQLQAHADEFNELLYKLRSSPPETGLNNVASVTLGVDMGNNGYQPIQPPVSTDYDFIIIVAVIVAGCSMVLLAFALYLAFRRRHYTGARQMVQTKLSPRTETERSPTSNRTSSPPPVQVMEVHPEHDDNISDYTESVFSLPAQTKQKKIKENLADSSIRKAPKVSNRFNPRYIISSKKSSDGDSDDKSVRDDDTSVGIPHLASSEKKSDSVNGNVMSQTPQRTDKERSGLYPADIIDDDITTSLSAYGKGVGIRNKYQHNDDGLSLSSVESYGFSLDGVGDQSTFANSTKYGY